MGAAFGGLTWRLARGPISLDLATPWLVKAMQDKIGGQQRVEVGGTQIEGGPHGKTSLRLLDVLLRDSDGTVVASAPKVEVGLSGMGLLLGQIRAERISLVGAEVSVRIETDGKLTVFAGGNARPIATTPLARIGAPRSAGAQAKPEEKAAETLYGSVADGFAAMLAWIDGLGKTGLDGSELSEIGLKDGTLVVEDQREGARWTFDHIDVSMTRPLRGGVRIKVQSGQPGRLWSIEALASPTKDDRRSIQLEAVRLPAKDLLLALRFADLPFKADFPVSVRLQAQIGPSGVPEVLQGAIVAEAGVIGGGDNGEAVTPVEHAAINFEWSAARRALLVPLQIVLGGNRFTLLGRIDAPAAPGAPWLVQVGGGSIVLGADTRSPLVLNRIRLNARFDPNGRQFRLVDGELGNSETGLALSGGYDYSGPPRLILGLAARRMPMQTAMQLWPTFVARNIRAWIAERVMRASVEQIDVAINTPVEVLESQDMPIPDDGLSISASLGGVVFRPVGFLPNIQDADLTIRTTGRTATVRLGHGTLMLPSGRKLALSEAEFRVPDTHLKPPKSQTRTRVQGPVAAVAELLATERLRAAAGDVLDPVTSRGNVDARVTLGIPLLKDLTNASVDYAVDADFTNFSAERLLLGQKLEAASLHLNGDNAGYRIKGDVKIAGTPVSLDYRKQKGPEDDEIRLQGVLDDKMRARLGFDLAAGLTGPVPIKLAGRMASNGQNGRFAVDADLTQARIDELLPGLVKPPAKPARATFTVVTRPDQTRIDDIVFDGVGATVRGNVVVDENGSLMSANFPVFSLSSGDKASLKAERGGSGGLHATLRGDVLDGRPFISSILAGRDAKDGKPRDLDLDAKIGAIAGHHGEALRGLELKLSRRDGQIQSLALKAKLGRNAALNGDLRQVRNGQPSLTIEAGDAGALFRFTDTYARVNGGHMVVSMDPPSSDGSPLQGTLRMENFNIRGEAALDRIVAGAAGGQRSGVEFTALRVDFTRTPGQFAIRDGVVRGPLIGGTIDGNIDYRRDDVRMRGTLVPLFGLNNMFGQLPIVGLFLGGGRNEGLLGITYEVTGSVGAPTLRVNPISAVAPGFVRKFFEFPSANGTNRSPGALDSSR